MIANKKYVLYALIKPYDLKMSLVFSIESRIRYIQEFIEDTMRNYRAKYRVGRIEHKKTASILLPDYKIGEVLEDKDEIIVYSIEYGLTKKVLSDKSSIEDIDKLFIGKKTKKDRTLSRPDSIDKKIPKKEEESEEEEDNNEEDNNEEDEDEEKEEKEEKDEKKEKNSKNENNKKKHQKEKLKKETKKNNKNKKEEDNSSNSGDDKSQDIQL